MNLKEVMDILKVGQNGDYEVVKNGDDYTIQRVPTLSELVGDEPMELEEWDWEEGEYFK